jgi:WD40 repeat protein
VIGNDVAWFRWRINQPESVTGPVLEGFPLFRPEGFRFLSLHSNSIAMTTDKGSQLLPLDRVHSGAGAWQPTARGLNKVSPDGRWLAINAPWSELVFIYKLPGLEPVAKLAHVGNVADFVFSPDGNELALASSKGVQFWSTSDWKPTRMLTNFTGILFQPASRAIWLTKDFRTAGLYDAETLESLLLLPNGMLPLAVSQDGRQLAISVDLRRLQVWDLEVLRGKLRELGMDWSQQPSQALR